MSSNYPTIQQHEPLRVPSGWGAQEKRFIAQLEEIFDDLYSRFNRLKMSDLGKELRNTIMSASDGVEEVRSEILQKADAIEFNVLKQRVDDQKIGGVNLLLDSGRTITNNDYSAAVYWPSEILQEGAEYTVSMCVTPAANVTDFRMILSSGYYTNAVLEVTGTAKQIVSKTFTAHYYPGRVPSSPTDPYARAVFYRFPNDGTVTADSTIHWVKVEKGNQATDWNPAPEDPVETVDNTSVRIDTTGVTMRGGIMDFQAGSAFKVRSGGKFNVFAADDESQIIFGGTEQSPNFSLGAGGIVKAKKVITDELETASGSLMQVLSGSISSQVIVSDSQPSGHGILWVQPSSSSGTLDFILDHSAGEDMTGQTPTNTVSGFARQGSALSGSTCKYGVKFRIYNYSGACDWYGVQVKCQKADGTGNQITIYERNFAQEGTIPRIAVGGYFEVDSLSNPSAALENQTGASALKLIVTIYKSASTGARFEINQNFVIRCTGTSAGAAQTCTLKYIP